MFYSDPVNDIKHFEYHHTIVVFRKSSSSLFARLISQGTPKYSVTQLSLPRLDYYSEIPIQGDLVAALTWLQLSILLLCIVKSYIQVRWKIFWFIPRYYFTKHVVKYK